LGSGKGTLKAFGISTIITVNDSTAWNGRERRSDTYSYTQQHFSTYGNPRSETEIYSSNHLFLTVSKTIVPPSSTF
jgi:hypothetical protein